MGTDVNGGRKGNQRRNGQKEYKRRGGRREQDGVSAKRRCVVFLSAEAFDIFSQGEDLESCGVSWGTCWGILIPGITIDSIWARRVSVHVVSNKIVLGNRALLSGTFLCA